MHLKAIAEVDDFMHACFSLEEMGTSARENKSIAHLAHVHASSAHSVLLHLRSNGRASRQRRLNS